TEPGFIYLLILCCFLSLLTGAGFLTGIGQRSDQYICARKGGTCNFSPCPLFTRIDGTCYRGKAKCCMP
uniref:Beta-defensin 1 n=1 Tax=Canis lupus dingo TaxID=286419 RepID=A0A8C0KHC3_CANLU